MSGPVDPRLLRHARGARLGVAALVGLGLASAAATIRRATTSRPSTVLGIPPSSSVRPTTAAPYFLHSGRMASRERCSPFTELTIGLPL